MGGRPSKKQNSLIKSYKNTFRAYAKWDHHSSPITHDISRFTAHEINNLKRHNQLIRHSPNEEQSNNLSIKKVRIDHLPRLKIEKSQSVEQLSNSKNIITVQQLIQNQFERRQKSFSTTNLNQQIPLNLQLVLINQNDLQVNIFFRFKFKSSF
jgi:hypothetical protein